MPLDPVGRLAAATYTLRRTTERAARAAGSRNHAERLREVAQRVSRARQSLQNAVANINDSAEAGDYSDDDLESIASAREAAQEAHADACAVANTLSEIAEDIERLVGTYGGNDE